MRSDSKIGSKTCASAQVGVRDRYEERTDTYQSIPPDLIVSRARLHRQSENAANKRKCNELKTIRYRRRSVRIKNLRISMACVIRASNNDVDSTYQYLLGFHLSTHRRQQTIATASATVTKDLYCHLQTHFSVCRVTARHGGVRGLNDVHFRKTGVM